MRADLGTNLDAKLDLGDAMAFTKAELAEALFEQLGLNKREAKEFVDLFFEEIRGALSKRRAGEAVRLWQFRAARQEPAPGPQSEDR